MTSPDAGEVLATYRAWPPAGLLAVLVLAALALVGLVAVVRPDPVMMLVVAAPPLLAAIAFVVGGSLDKILVCRHGLRLGFRSTIVVPYASIDPGRVYAIRGLFAARHVPAAVTSTRATAGRVIALNGASAGGFSLAPSGPVPAGPFGWYLLGVRRQPAFLADLESAMVADGQPARGLADTTTRLRSVRAGWSTSGPPLVVPRGAQDPPLGVMAPSPRAAAP